MSNSSKHVHMFAWIALAFVYFSDKSIRLHFKCVNAWYMFGVMIRLTFQRMSVEKEARAYGIRLCKGTCSTIRIHTII